MNDHRENAPSDDVDSLILDFIADTMSGGNSLEFRWTRDHDGERQQETEDGFRVWLNATIGDPDESHGVEGESVRDGLIAWIREAGTPVAVAKLEAALHPSRSIPSDAGSEPETTKGAPSTGLPQGLSAPPSSEESADNSEGSKPTVRRDHAGNIARIEYIASQVERQRKYGEISPEYLDLEDLAWLCTVARSVSPVSEAPDASTRPDELAATHVIAAARMAGIDAEEIRRVASMICFAMEEQPAPAVSGTGTALSDAEREFVERVRANPHLGSQLSFVDWIISIIDRLSSPPSPVSENVLAHSRYASIEEAQRAFRKATCKNVGCTDGCTECLGIENPPCTPQSNG